MKNLFSGNIFINTQSPQTFFSIIIFVQTIFSHFFFGVLLFVLNITIALLNYEISSK